MTRRIFPRLPIRLVALLALLLPLCAAFAESKVRTNLSSSSVSVGEAVEFEITVSGDERATRPELPVVDGLEISFAGGGQRSTMILGGSNSNLKTIYTFTYAIIPRREGKFTIPAVEVRAGGSVLKTLPVTLTVAPVENMKEAGDFAFAKIVLAKKSLYVGEVAPLEVRFYLDANARWQFRAMPTLSGDGFTLRPLGKPSERNVQLAGKTYDLATFSTVLTPGRAGKISIGPEPVNLVMSKPDPQRRNFMGGTMMGPARDMTVSAPALDIEVKPLPVAGRPKDFSGAIGKFEFAATGSPPRVKVGEPVSMKLTIRGSGNFDRIGQPQLAEAAGWTTYSAKEEFQGSDSAGTEGVKTFELPVTPTTGKTAMPVFAFSYFDPEAAKYVTLLSDGGPLIVEGAPAIVVPAPAPTAGKNAEAPKAEAKPAAQEILANLPDIGAASAAFGPGISPAAFFAMMFAPAPVVFAFVAWRRRRSDGKLARIAALRRERSALLSKVKGGASRAEVLDAAVKAMRIHAQLENAGTPVGDEADSLLGSRKLDAETEKSLREIFEMRAELLYAGAARVADGIGDRERDRVLDAVASFERSARR